jgi:hypothetical protein
MFGMGKHLENELDEMYDFCITGTRKGIYTTGRKVKNAFSTASRYLGKGLQKLTLVVAAAPFALGIGGCLPTPLTPEESPVVEGSATLENNVVPALAHIIVGATDRNNNIADYSVFIDGNGNGREDPEEAGNLVPPQPMSINSTYTLTTPGNYGIYAKVTDSLGNASYKLLGNVSLVLPQNPPFEPPVEPPVDPPVNPPVQDKIDILKGKVQDSKEEIGRQSFLQFFDEYNPVTDTISSPIKITEVREGASMLDDYTIKTTTTGNFGVTLDKVVNSNANDKIYVRARLIDSNENPLSYPRTIGLPATDHSNLSAGSDLRANPAIRAVMYNDENLTLFDSTANPVIDRRDDFREDVGRKNVWSVGERITNNFYNDDNRDGIPDPGEVDQIILNPSHGLKKLGVQEILISSSFTNPEELRSTVLNQFNEYKNLGQIPATIASNLNESGVTGYGIIVPSAVPNQGGTGTKMWDNNADGYVDGFVVYANHPSSPLLHEYGIHGYFSSGHPDSPAKIALFDSVGRYTSYDERYSPPQAPKDFTPADKKLADIVDEETFLGMEPLHAILGKN